MLTVSVRSACSLFAPGYESPSVRLTEAQTTNAVVQDVDWVYSTISRKSATPRSSRFGSLALIGSPVSSITCDGRTDGGWFYYNFAVEIFHTQKLCSRLYSTEVELYFLKQKKSFLSHPLGQWSNYKIVTIASLLSHLFPFIQISAQLVIFHFCLIAFKSVHALCGQ